MKKGLLLLLLGLCLTGCAKQETMETIGDEWVQPVMAAPREITVRLPDGAIAPVLKSDTEQMYLCDDYQLLLETRDAGNLAGTVQAVSGFPMEDLTVLHTERDGIDRYDFVWVCAGETGELAGRAAILDDGTYHYCLSVLRNAADTKKTQIVWSDVFQSFGLASSY